MLFSSPNKNNYFIGITTCKQQTTTLFNTTIQLQWIRSDLAWFPCPLRYAVTVHDRLEVFSVANRSYQIMKSYTPPMADPDFELRRGAGSILLAQLAFLHSAISLFFPPKIRDSCCAQMCILLAFTKAIDLKIHLSLTCESTISQQKHFSTRVSLPATHQGSVKVSLKAKHLGCFEIELTP